MDFPLTRAVLDAAVAGRATPAVVIEVGRRAGALWTHAAGTLTYDPGAPRTSVETIFDLASLTKVIATTSLTMRHVGAGRLELDRPLGTWLPGWSAGARATVTIRHLLEHSSGLPAHGRYWFEARGRAAYEARIREVDLEAPPETRAVYSDLGFILLGFIIEDAGQASLAVQMEALNRDLDLGTIAYLPPADWIERTAPTEFDSWRNRLLRGEVHDENAAALGGEAGHAGLFGTAAAVGRFARAFMAALGGEPEAARHLPLAREFVRPSRVPGSSRALGWDTMRPTSSCGRRLTSRAFGHTGFTGTSLWIDPELDLYVVLLSNRVHPSRTNEAFVKVRPQVHDAVVEDLQRTGL